MKSKKFKKKKKMIYDIHVHVPGKIMACTPHPFSQNVGYKIITKKTAYCKHAICSQT